MTGLTEDTNRKTYGPFNLFKNLKFLHPQKSHRLFCRKKVRRNPNKSFSNCRLFVHWSKEHTSIFTVCLLLLYQIYQFRLSWDKNPDKAWDELLDQLMDSQHFGERSAQHWLDVTRYADTAGLSNDYERSNMWRYRDYVVRSFNEDKPYDRFIIEQIAGDELWEKQTQDEKIPELLIATSFFENGAMGSGHGSQASGSTTLSG